MLGLLTTVAAGVLVVMLASAWLSHRARRQLAAHASSLLTELIWSVVPWLILLAAALPAAIVIMRDN